MALPLQNQVDELVGTLLSLVAARQGRLLAVTIAGPTVDEELVGDRLRRLGLDGVLVRVRTSPGPLRVLRLEFGR